MQMWHKNVACHLTALTGTTIYPDSKIHGANMGPNWVLSAPDGPDVGPMNLVIRAGTLSSFSSRWILYVDRVIDLQMSRNDLMEWQGIRALVLVDIPDSYSTSIQCQWVLYIPVYTLIARFMGPTWGPLGAGRTQVGPMLAAWTLLSG